jgi:Tol biopolymer transport system component
VTPLDTGVPVELQTGLPEGAKYHGFSWSPDGQKLAFAGSFGGDPEFWMISDLLP